MVVLTLAIFVTNLRINVLELFFKEKEETLLMFIQ